MGRHSAPDAPEPDSGGPDPVAAGLAGPHPTHPLLDRIALAAAAAGGTGAVMAWAGAEPTAYLLGAAGTGVVVVVAARLAGALPGPARPRGDRGPDREP